MRYLLRMRTIPTPPERRDTAAGHAYFLWDTDVSWAGFVARLRSADRAEADYWLARALRDARPDDVLLVATLEDIAAAWPRVHHRLGRKRAFWAWLLQRKGLDVQPG